MTDSERQTDVEQAQTEARDRGFELDSTLVEAVEEALEREDAEQLRELIADVHDADVADLVQSLDGGQRRAFVTTIRDDFHPQILAELDENVRDDVIEVLGLQETAAAISELETDDAVLVLSELDKDEQRKVLEEMLPEDRALIEEGLAYQEDSAGRLMRRELVAVPTFWSVGEIIDYLRQAADQDEVILPQDFHDIFVVDPGHRPVGAITLSRLLRTRRPVLVTDIMRLGGVTQDDLYSATIDTARSRFTWLLVNLGTAVLASFVIGMFENAIEKVVALAVLMPIVASMGGNAGTQTLTVAVRALATKELTPANATRVISKELLVGIVNGCLFAVTTAVVAWIWFENLGIVVVIALAMIVNLVVAALSGATIPLLLERFGIDPAVASSVFLTTVTDVVGFFAFLGLASLLLL